MAKLGGSEEYGAASARADLLIVVEVFAHDGDDRPAATCFAHLCLATGRHAQFEAEQTFAMLKVTSSHAGPLDYNAKIVLDYVFHDFVEPRKAVKPHLNRQSVGIPHLLTEADFAAHILFDMLPVNGRRDHTLVKRVIFRQLLFEDMSLNRLRTLGAHGRLEDVVASAGREKPAPAQLPRRKGSLSLLDEPSGRASWPGASSSCCAGGGHRAQVDPTNGASSIWDELADIMAIDEDMRGARAMYAAFCDAGCAGDLEQLAALDLDDDGDDGSAGAGAMGEPRSQAAGEAQHAEREEPQLVPATDTQEPVENANSRASRADLRELGRWHHIRARAYHRRRGGEGDLPPAPRLRLLVGGACRSRDGPCRPCPMVVSARAGRRACRGRQSLEALARHAREAAVGQMMDGVVGSCSLGLVVCFVPL